MDILSVAAITGMAIVVEQGLKLVDVVGRQRKVVALAELPLGGQPGHLLPVVAVEAVAADHGGAQSLTGEHPAEDLPGCRGAGTAGAGHGNDRMAL